MGVVYHCPNCSHCVCMNAYSKAVENGYCGRCDIDDLRKAVKARKAECLDLRESHKRLQAEVDKLKPKPCTRCQCAACKQAELARQCAKNNCNPWGRV